MVDRQMEKLVEWKYEWMERSNEERTGMVLLLLFISFPRSFWQYQGWGNDERTDRRITQIDGWNRRWLRYRHTNIHMQFVNIYLFQGWGALPHCLINSIYVHTNIQI